MPLRVPRLTSGWVAAMELDEHVERCSASHPWSSLDIDKMINGITAIGQLAIGTIGN